MTSAKLCHALIVPSVKSVRSAESMLIASVFDPQLIGAVAPVDASSK